MTWKDRTIIIESVVIVLLIVACVCVWKFYYNPEIVFKWEGKTSDTKYDKGGDKSDKYFTSPIWIDGTQRGKYFDVRAGDAYKSASRTLGVDIAVRHHVPMITYSPLYNIEAREFRHQLSGAYYYNVGPFAIGGGLTTVFSDNKVHDIGPTIGLAVFIR
jgi:hypothetical protein